MRRVGRTLLGFVGALAILGFLGTGDGRGLPVVLPIIGAGVLAWIVWGYIQRRRPMTPGGWTPTEALVYVPPSARPGGPGPGVSLALARVETRELVTSVSFGIGMGFCVLLFYVFGFLWSADSGGNVPELVEMTAIMIHPFAGMLVVGSFRARTRGRRDGAEELYVTCPTPESARTIGHLLTTWAPALLTIAFTTGFALVASQAVTPYGEIGARQASNLIGPSLLAIGAVCLGVALARWLPWTIVPVAAVIAVGFGTAHLATLGTRTTTPLRQLSTFLVDPELDLRLTAPHWLAHHLWILSLVAIVAVLALVRDHRGPVVGVAAVASVALAVASGIAATRPIDAADAQRIATLLTDPAALPCADTHGFDVCTYDGDEALRDEIFEAASDVAAVVPDGALDGWSVRQDQEVDWEDLDPEVLALIGGVPARDPRVLPIEFTAHKYALEALRLWTSLAAVGVLDNRVAEVTTSVRGQARGVIALWLATHGLDDTAQLDVTSVGSQRSGAHVHRPWPDICYAGSPPVQWAETDVTAARQMLELPEEQVRQVVLADWERLTDLDTSSDRLMEALGLEPVGIAGFTSGPGEC